MINKSYFKVLLQYSNIISSNSQTNSNRTFSQSYRSNHCKPPTRFDAKSLLLSSEFFFISHCFRLAAIKKSDSQYVCHNYVKLCQDICSDVFSCDVLQKSFDGVSSELSVSSILIQCMKFATFQLFVSCKVESKLCKSFFKLHRRNI